MVFLKRTKKSSRHLRKIFTHSTISGGPNCFIFFYPCHGRAFLTGLMAGGYRKCLITFGHSGDLWGHLKGNKSWQILFLTSLPVCRAFEQSASMFYSFAVRGCRTHLLSPQKIISILVPENPNLANFWAIWTICTSNQSWEHSQFKFDMNKI